MKSLNRLLTVLALILCAGHASAQISVSLGYTDFSIDEFRDLDSGMAQGTFGFKIPLIESDAGGIHFLPEARVGVSVNEDDDTELDALYGVNGRLQFESGRGLYGFVYPSFTHYKARVELEFETLETDTWDLGYGGGIGIALTNQLGLEVGYERIDDAELINASLRFGF